MSPFVQVFGRRGDETDHSGWQQALWRSHVDAALDVRRRRSTGRWASRRTRGVHQRAVGGLTDGTGSRSGSPHRGTLPQLSRLGMNVAQKGI